MKRIISRLNGWLKKSRNWLRGLWVDYKIRPYLSLPSYKDNLHVAVITDLEGYIRHYNETGKVYFGSDLEAVKGSKLEDYFLDGDRQEIAHLFKLQQFAQPYTLHGVQLLGLSETLVVRFYRNSDAGYCLVFLESVHVSEEMLLSEEEHKWAERLQIMLFGISHELKTPLATAKGYTEILERENQAEAATRVMSALDKIGEILRNMTDPLRELNKDSQSVDLGKALEDYAKTMNYTEPTKRYIGQFSADIEAALGKRVKLSRSRFYQILTNLFENSVRAVDHLGTSGNIRITTRECAKPHHSDCIVMEFADNGVGMPSESAQKIFTPYYTTRTPETGTGLGAYFVYQFVLDADGNIEVFSRPNEGTKFVIHLPYEG